MTRTQQDKGLRWRDAAARWLADPASPRPLAWLRIGLASILLIQGLWIARDRIDLCGLMGIDPASLNDYFASFAPRGLPHVRWIADFLGSFGVEEVSSLRAIFLGYLVSLGCLLLGYQSRLAALGAWFCHSLLLGTGYFFIYGVNRFAEVALFYLIWMPAGRAFSLDVWSGRTPETASAGARLSLRVLQIHLCLAYLAAGLVKIQGSSWWNGEAIWRAAMLPQFHLIGFGWLAAVPWLAALIGYGILILEIGYAVFVWPTATRRHWMLAIILLHLGMALCLGLATSSAVMITLTVAAFGVSAEPERLRHPSLRWFSSIKVRRQRAAALRDLDGVTGVRTSIEKTNTTITY